jgi:hypothetical protein
MTTDDDDTDTGMVNSHQQRQGSKSLTLVLVLCAACLLLQTSLLQYKGLKGSTTISKRGLSRVLPETVELKDDDEENNDGSQSQQGLFVPSLDFRFPGGASQYAPGVHADAHVYCEEFAKDLLWEWWQADESTARKLGNLKGDSKAGSGKTTSTQKRLMIGLYAGYDVYAKLLQQSVWSARLYGQIWGQNVTVVTLQGTSFTPHGCKAPPAHTTLNKIRLLFHAIDHDDEYDQVLLLDADTMVYNLDIDLTTLMDPEHHLVAAQHAPGDSQTDNGDDLWNIDTGVLLWNLHHPESKSVALDWFESAKKSVVRGTYLGDQKYLQSSLRTHLKWQRDKYPQTTPMVLNLQNDEFNFEKGTVVKHFWNHNSHDDNIDKRWNAMRDAADEMCTNHRKACGSVVEPQYETS